MKTKIKVNAFSIQDQANNKFIQACIDQDMGKMKDWLESLEYRIDIGYNDESALQTACTYGNLEMIKYLLESPNLKKHSNIYANGCSPFRSLLGHYSFEKKLYENEVDNRPYKLCVDYIIDDYKIVKKDDFILDYPEITKRIELRDLNNKLSQNLSNNNNKIKKVKI